MKSQLIAIVAAVLVVGCGPSVSIHDAATKGNIEAVKQHLDAGADVELKCVNCGGTVLRHAVSGGHIEIVELLVSKDADVNAKTEEGESPLHLAANRGHKEIIELLIARGADVDAKGDSGRTPLHVAAQKGHKEIIELLIAKGADVDAKGGWKEGTPLLYAATYGHKEVVELLIAKGADVNAKDDDGETPLDVVEVT